MSIHFGAKVNTPRQKHGLFLLLGKHRKRKACLAMRQAKLSKLAYYICSVCIDPISTFPPHRSTDICIENHIALCWDIRFPCSTIYINCGTIIFSAICDMQQISL